MFHGLYLLVSCLLATPFLHAQNVKDNNGTIKGAITTNDGKPAPLVTIGIKNAKWGDISNEQGTYTIKNVRPGTWTLIVSAGQITEVMEKVDDVNTFLMMVRKAFV
jgi:iron complex outermembrane recepter protein